MDLIKLEESFFNRLNDDAAKYPDIKILVDSHHRLVKQNKFTEEFLSGYLACISDLTYIKKLA